MPRGAASEVGTERQAKNGYVYVKTKDRDWVLKHWLVLEEARGFKVDQTKESIRFKDGNRANFDIKNIVSIPKGKVQLRAKIARLEVQLQEVQAQLDYYNNELSRELASELSN